MPGPDIIYVALESITRGAKTGILIALGLVSGLVIHTFFAAVGLSFVLQNSPIAYNLLKIFGAIYLFYLAYLAWGEKPVELNNKRDQKVIGIFALWRKGFFMNVLNPKVSLFFIALLPQFINPDGMHVPTQMMVLGAIFMLQAIVIFTIVSLFAGTLNKYLGNSSFWQIAKWAKIIVLIILALGLIFSSI